MKTKTLKPRETRGVAVVVAAIVSVGAFTLAAHAESSAPQAQAQSQASSSAPAAPASGKAGAAPSGAVVVARKAPKSEIGLVDKVKTWVMDKWNEWRGIRPNAVAKTPSAPAAKSGQASARPTTATTTAGAPPASPSTMLGQNLAAPSGRASTSSEAKGDSSTQAGSSSTGNRSYAGPIVRDLPKTSSGVPVYRIAPNIEAVPRLDIGREERVSSSRYLLDDEKMKFFDQMVAHQKESPAVLTAKEMATLKKLPTAPGSPQKVKTVFFHPKGKVSREGIDKVSIALAPVPKIDLKKYVPLTQDELRFLSGLLLYQQGDKCAVAVGLFHDLAKAPKYTAEGNFYLAMCSKKLGLVTDFVDRARRVVETQDPYYAKKILPHIDPDVPYEHLEPLGGALLKAANNGAVMSFEKPETAGNIHYILANYGAQTENYKVSARYGKMVPESHAKWPQAHFLMALGEYQVGSKSKALEQQTELVSKLSIDKTKSEFQALVSLNLARMYFQEKKFKEAHEWFLKVYKDHPLWLQSLQEMGWAQLMSGDYEGAIGNMYSVQSPYFQAVYKPDSYVIRTIGYLNLCQYGDAYRTLTQLEKQYRPWLDKIASYQSSGADYLGSVRKFMTMKTATAEIDGLPSQVIREMARHKDFLNLQNALNRQIDEREAYKKLDGEVEKSLKRARWLVTNSRKRADQLRTNIASIKKNPQFEANRLAWKSELDNELDLLNGYFFEIDLFNEAKESLQKYKTEVVGGAEIRIAKMKTQITTVLASRLKRMRTDLARVLDNNELLRYEVFAGSGENIRFQVAGGEKGNRVPANVVPQSKTLQWDFDGEYWEDEVGHYRSSLKNNCPDSQSREHASL